MKTSKIIFRSFARSKVYICREKYFCAHTASVWSMFVRANFYIYLNGIGIYVFCMYVWRAQYPRWMGYANVFLIIVHFVEHLFSSFSFRLLILDPNIKSSGWVYVTMKFCKYMTIYVSLLKGIIQSYIRSPVIWKIVNFLHEWSDQMTTVLQYFQVIKQLNETQREFICLYFLFNFLQTNFF